MGWLRNLLTEPRVREIDVDSAESTAAHREVLRTKPLVRRLFARFYREIMQLDTRFFGDTPGSRWEVGSGAGFFGELYPDVVTSDIKVLPFVDIAAEAHALPVDDGSLRAVYLVNCFHHLPDPAAFFAEMVRALAPGGGFILIEPFWGPVAALMFRNLHASEGFWPDAPSWQAPDDAGPMSRANQALSYVVFRRDRARFEEEFPELELIVERPHTHLTYLLSGGVNFRALVPAWSGPIVEGVEWLLRPAAPILALQQSIVVRKRSAAHDPGEVG